MQVTTIGVSESAFFTQGDITVFNPGFVDNIAGQILGVADALMVQSPVNGSDVLADVQFTAIGAATSPLTWADVYLTLSDSGFTVTAGEVCMNVVATCGAPVPEPGTVALLALGLALLTWRGRLTSTR